MKKVISQLVWIAVMMTLTAVSVRAEVVSVPVGTVVDARFIADVQPSDVMPGDSVLLIVDKDVVVSDKIVIKAGSKIVAEVADAKKTGYAGQSGRILLSFRSVTAVDNQEIALSGSSRREGDDSMVESIGLGLVCCPLFLLMKGEEGIIKAGQTVKAYTINEAKVKVDEQVRLR